MKRKVLVVTLFLLMLAGLGLLSSCGTAAGAAALTPTALPPVQSDASVLAEAKVVPVRSAEISFAATGVVAEVLVEEGAAVAEGDVIARLSGVERAQAAVSAADLELKSANQALKDLNDNAELAAAQALLKVADAEKKLDKAKDKRTSKDYQWGDQEQIDIAWANYIAAEEEVKKREEDYNLFADRDQDDPQRAYVLSLLANARQVRDKALANYNFLVGKPDQLEINQADAELTVAQAELDKATADYEKVKNGPDPEQLALAEARVSNAEAQLAAAQAGLEDLELRAPFAGVLAANDLQIGELVGAGPAPVVVAELTEWKVETIDLTELNITNVEIGQPVTVTVDALDDLELTGTVSRIKEIGEDRLGDITYRVEIKLDDQDPRLLWNMTAVVRFEK